MVKLPCGSASTNRTFCLHRQPDTQIFTGSGLAGAAFLVDDGNRGCFL